MPFGMYVLLPAVPAGKAPRIGKPKRDRNKVKQSRKAARHASR